jgi:hypothetical protein
MCGGSCAALEFVDVNHVQAVSGAGVVVGTFGGSECGAKRQTTDSSHAIDADFHGVLL